MVFPMGVRKATNHTRRGSCGGDPGLVISTSPHPGWSRKGQESLPFHLPHWEVRSWGGSQADGPGSQRVPWWLFGNAREEPLAKRVSPLGRR